MSGKPEGTDSSWLGRNVLFNSKLRTVDRLHRLAHQGLIYHTRNAVAALGAGSSMYVQVTIPADKVMHIIDYEWYGGEQPSTRVIWENPTLTTGDVALPAINVNRLLSEVHTSDVAVFSNPTGISVGSGLILDTHYAPASKFSSGSSFPVSGVESFLKTASTYILQLTNTGPSATAAFIRVQWHEEDL